MRKTVCSADNSNAWHVVADRATAQAVGSRRSAAAAWVRFRIGACGAYGGRRGIGQVMFIARAIRTQPHLAERQTPLLRRHISRGPESLRHPHPQLVT